MNIKPHQPSAYARKARAFQSLVLLTASLLFGGCRAVGALFKAGVWTGVIVVVVLLAIVGGAVSLFRKT